jgi:hypothetical protein
MAEILTAEKLIEKNKSVGEIRDAVVYANGKEDIVKNTNPEIIHAESYEVGEGKWHNSAGQRKLYSEMKELQTKIEGETKKGNSASAPDISALIAKLYIDVQRYTDDLADYTGELFNVINRPDLQEINYLRDLIPYVGKEDEIVGNGDPVPLIQQMTASTEQITLAIRGFGWKGSLKNTLFNSLHNMQRVNQAAARIMADEKNAQSIGAIVAPAYHANYSQAADSTSGATYDEKLYNTLRKAYKKLGTFTHPLTGITLAQLGAFTSGVKILCSPTDAWSIARVVNGELSRNANSAVVGSPLPIAGIIPYGGGIQNGLTYGLKTLAYTGVAAGYAYMILPLDLGAFVATKVAGQMELSVADPLTLSAEVKSWYRATGANTTWMLSGAASGSGGCLVCKIALPADS